MRRCDKCSLEFPDTFSFCGSCGAALTDSRRCPSCGQLNESKWRFCKSCGTSLLSEPPETQTLPASELPAAQTNSLRTQELDAPGHTPSESAQETTIRYNEPGELYGTDLHRDSTARLAEPEAYRTASLDNSETAELVGESETILPAAVPPVNNTSAPTPQVSQLTVAASSAREVRAAPTLSMM